RHGLLQFGLTHLGAALDAELLGVVVELFAGAAAGAVTGLLAAAGACRGAAFGAARGGFGLARAGFFLVYGARRDLLGAFGRPSLAFLRLFDLFVLTVSFGAFFYPSGRHASLLELLDDLRVRLHSFRCCSGTRVGIAQHSARPEPAGADDVGLGA